MVFDAHQLRERINKFLAAVGRQYFVERALLYGSYARGEQRDGSDIDLVIISPDFRRMPKLKRHQELHWIAWQARTTYIEPLGFTPEEYENASPLGLLGEVKETGVVVYQARPQPALRESPAPYSTKDTASMKIVIPLAGYGKRLRPHTFTKPKPLVNVAGKPVLGHVLDMFQSLDNVEEIIFIVGHLGEQIEEYVEKNYPHIKASYYEQKVLDGQSTAIYLARERLTGGPMLMVFVDTIVETDLSQLKHETADAIAWVKEVPDPRRFGVAEVGPDGWVTRLIEKPKDMSNNLVVVGFYYFKDSALLVDCIREQIERNVQTQNEYFLADAVNLMLQRGVKMRVQKVDVWQDCGKVETVLETNRYLLSHGHDTGLAHSGEGVVVVPPVNIHPTARLRYSVIGPYTTIAAGCHVENAIIRDSILDEGAVVHDALLANSLIGKDARLSGRFRAFNIGEASEVGFEGNPH